MQEPYMMMRRVMVLFKAAGLKVPAVTRGEKLRLLDVWVARYGTVDAAVFLAAARRLMGGCYFPRFCDMDAAVREEQRRRKRMAEVISGTQRADAGDREANRRRVQVLIENLSKRRL
ncbi:hypothetical protein [Phascolarctobacterium sp.]